MGGGGIYHLCTIWNKQTFAHVSPGVGDNSLMNQFSLSNTQTLVEKFQVNNYVKMWPESNPFPQPPVRHGPQQQTESLSAGFSTSYSLIPTIIPSGTCSLYWKGVPLSQNPDVRRTSCGGQSCPYTGLAHLSPAAERRLTQLWKSVISSLFTVTVIIY